MTDNLTVQPDHGSTTEESLSFDELANAIMVQRITIQHGAEGTAPDAPGGGGMFRQPDVVALVDQDFREQFANADFVVNDQNDCHG